MDGTPDQDISLANQPGYGSAIDYLTEARDRVDIPPSQVPSHNWKVVPGKWRYKGGPFPQIGKNRNVMTFKASPLATTYEWDDAWVPSRSTSQSLVSREIHTTGKADKRILHLRDGGLCGIHSGGCGGQIDISSDDLSRDELVPRSYFNSKEAQRFENEWFAEWNTQIMHQKCNAKRGAHEVPPRYECQCHFAYVDVEKGTLSVLYAYPGDEWERYTVSDGVIGPYFAIGRAIPNPQPDRGGGTVYLAQEGWAGKNSDRIGLELPLFTEIVAHSHNISEMSRVDSRWFSKMYAIINHAITFRKFRAGLDGNFRFRIPIGAGALAPRLTFAMPARDAELFWRTGDYVYAVRDGMQLKFAQQKVVEPTEQKTQERPGRFWRQVMPEDWGLTELPDFRSIIENGSK